MENIFLPSKIELKEGEMPNEGVLIIEPLFHGYGTTIGNALRRVILSSLLGAAVTSFKIKGTQHEFSTIKGIYEDILEIVLNMKQLRLKLYSAEPVVLKLVKKGEGAVTAKDITKDAMVEIINPGLKIATITDKNTELNMEITVEKGMGYEPTENRNKENLAVGAIAIDAIFTPIVDVGFKVENTRIGQITNYDKLIFTIKTDGTITPEYAINCTVKLLLDHFNLLYKQDLPSETKKEDEPAKKKPDKVKKAKKAKK
ncbi:MAG: DNA-directed RNA polymerase subunit alpha [Candidatus Buchananbacteria bacterium RBG_13_36_9]|uniref:DNA-directed RNA polymerase subunit alpha n=1 Tax=Candidatus Buchananbacteria bacterium RBG_13_36_9 TaxID=1797530 RepID=A0A1G1XR49_9BACT|nr:MAG: DNA-directed RNA polymerase subunit alpha [Candidatus Buchananbacteria bacterium RBG_13_36_9]